MLDLLERCNNLPALSVKGFSHINRFYDRARRCISAKILPGEYYVTIADEHIVTVLGSCVSACIRDKVFGIGGMNHFMLPRDYKECDPEKFNISDAARYGNYAMEHLINTILKNGGRRENLEVKIVGGAKIIANMSDIGQRNVQFVKDYLETEGLTLLGEDVGDVYPRKVDYYPSTGKVRVKKLRSVHNDTLVDRETVYANAIEQKPVVGDIELF